MMRRIVIILLSCTFLGTSAFAEKKPDNPKAKDATKASNAELKGFFKWDRSRTHVGFLMTRGTRNLHTPSLLQTDRWRQQALTGVLTLWRDDWYLDLETNWTLHDHYTQGHSIMLERDLFSIGPIKTGLGFRYAFSYQAEDLATFAYANIRVVQKNSMGFIQLPLRIGSIVGKSLSAGPIIGSLHNDTFLDITVGNTPERERYANEASTGIGWTIEAIFHTQRLSFRGEYISLIMPPRNGVFVDHLSLAHGSFLYLSPWHIGVFLRGTFTNDDKIIFFGNSVAYGIVIK